MWESGSWAGRSAVDQATFDAPVKPGTIRVAFADNPAIGPPVSRVTIRTAAGQVSDAVLVTGNPQPLRVPAGPSGWLRITVTAWPRRPVPLVGSQVGSSGHLGARGAGSRTSWRRRSRGPVVVVLAQGPSRRPRGCMLTSAALGVLTRAGHPDRGTVRIRPYFCRAFSERTVFTAQRPDQLFGGGQYAPAGPREAKVTASSTYTPDPQDQPRSVFDGNPATSWSPTPTTRTPRSHPVGCGCGWSAR